MIITISGKAGSGKSTVAKLLAKELELKHYSMGDLQRKYAKERGITIEELGKLEEKDDTIDREVDASQSELAKNQDNFVIDSWLGFHFIPKSIKIFLDCDNKVSAERIFKDIKGNIRDESERKAETVEEVQNILEGRIEVNRKRWIKYYSADFMDQNNYDLVINTSNISVQQVLEKTLEVIKSLLK